MYAKCRIVVISKEEKRNILLLQMFSRRIISTVITTRSRQYGLKTQSHPFSAATTQQDEPLLSDLSASYINLEEKYGAHNYHPLPVVLSKGEGMYVFLSSIVYTYISYAYL